MNEFLFDSESGKEQKPTSQDIADKLRTMGEEYGFDPETCDEIAELPFNEAFEAAYGYLVQAGIDPYEILAEFIESTD